MRPPKFVLPQAGTGGYGIRPYVFCGGWSPRAEAAPRVEFSLFVENEIRRGAFYMRPPRFILPQAGTGGYGIRPYVFVAGGPTARRGRLARSFLPLVENETRRGAFYMRPRKFILPQAGTGGYGIRPYIFCGGRSSPPRRGRCPAWSFLPLLKAKSVGAHSICARRSLSYRKRARADMESAPTFLKGRSPGQGARFCLLCVQADLFSLSPCQKPSYVVYYFSTSSQANPVQTGDAKLKGPIGSASCQQEIVVLLPPVASRPFWGRS